MVTPANIDYKQWKEDVYNIYYEKYGKSLADELLVFIKSRYDKFKRNFLPHRILWRELDLQRKIKKFNQHQVYGCFGRGGYGKSSLMKNVLYTHDPTFDQSRIATTMDGFKEVLYNLLNSKKSVKYKSILIDEPAKETHSASLEWRMTEDVLGQIRQQNFIIGICATNLNHVKSSIYSMITGLFAFRKHFTYDYYDDEKTEGIIGKIRERYDRTKTYKCFHDFDIRKQSYISNCYSYKQTPIDGQEKQYEKGKKIAFINKFRKLHRLYVTEKNLSVNQKTKIIKDLNKRLKEQGRTQVERAEILDLSSKTVYRYDEQIKNKNRQLDTT